MRRPGILNSARGAALLLVVVLIAGCGGGVNADIKAASQFQISAQTAYETAKADELKAIGVCRDAAIAAGAPLPKGLSHAEVEARCVAVKAPLPYSLDFLDGLQKGVDGLYDAVQAAVAVQDTANSDPAAASAARSKMIAALAALLKDVGVLKLPPDKVAAAKSLAEKR